MTAPRRPRPERLNAKFWREAFLAAEHPTVLRQGTKVTPIGLAHISAEYADAAVREFRMRFK